MAQRVRVGCCALGLGLPRREELRRFYLERDDEILAGRHELTVSVAGWGRRPCQTILRSDAQRANSWRLLSWSLRSTAVMWVSTVLTEMLIRVATCL